MVLSLLLASAVGCDDPAQPPPPGDASRDAFDATSDAPDVTLDAPGDTASDAPAMNAIERENAMPGSDGWLIQLSLIHISEPTRPY